MGCILLLLGERVIVLVSAKLNFREKNLSFSFLLKSFFLQYPLFKVCFSLFIQTYIFLKYFSKKISFVCFWGFGFFLFLRGEGFGWRWGEEGLFVYSLLNRSVHLQSSQPIFFIFSSLMLLLTNIT